MKAQITLTQPQQAAANHLLESLDTGNVVVLRGPAGSGKTTILESIHEERGGILLGARQFVGVAKSMAPAAIEESFLRMIEDAILGHELVLADDLQVLLNVVDNPRSYLLDAALTAILAEAGVLACKLVFAVEEAAPWPIERRARVARIGESRPD